MLQLNLADTLRHLADLIILSGNINHADQEVMLDDVADQLFRIAIWLDSQEEDTLKKAPPPFFWISETRAKSGDLKKIRKKIDRTLFFV